MASVPAEQPRRDVPASDAPTPPAGIPMDAAGPAREPESEDDATPPTGIPVSGVVTAQDYGRPSPTVLGGVDPMESHEDAGEWPTLEYRSRAKAEQRSSRNWLGRRRPNE
jgi:hypothetical protein